MCIWKRRCNELLNCVAASAVLGCQQGPGFCETCALGFLNTQMPDEPEPHKNPHATLGKLIDNIGWKITRPGRDSGLSTGDIITHLNGVALNTDGQTAAQVIVEFGEYRGGEVIVHVLRASGFRVEQVSFERV